VNGIVSAENRKLKPHKDLARVCKETKAHIGVAITEFPSNVDVASVALVAAASGGFSKVKTTVLITMDEAMEAMDKASQVASAFKPPAGQDSG